jgi:hypothetical protein
VQAIDPESGKPTRVRYEMQDDGSKIRVAPRRQAWIVVKSDNFSLSLRENGRR